MLQQYYRAKEAHPGVLLAMRVGDFFEFYGEDAELAAAALEITLTGREDGKNGRIPMAGVPFHAIEKYMGRLLGSGYRVALCDQVEDPKTAKGLVRREVTRVLTPGTVVEDSLLSAGRNNFLAAVCVIEGRAGLATLDPSTGEFLVTELDGDRSAERLLQELARVMPAELLVPPESSGLADSARDGLGLITTKAKSLALGGAEQALCEQFQVTHLGGYGIDTKPAATVAAGMVLQYAQHNGLSLGHVESLATYSVDGFMRLDPATRRSLELTQNLSDGSRRHTLLTVLDHTVTAMGARLLRRWIDQPLLDQVQIESRLDAVSRLTEHVIPRGDLRDELKRVADLERLVGRCATGYATPRDLGALAHSLQALPMIEESLRKVALGRLHAIRTEISLHQDLEFTLRQALADDLPLTAREGGVIRNGYDPELDKLRELSQSGKSFIARLEAAERVATGIDRLKVGYNAVFGYYLEVGKNAIDRVPDHYIRKQTTANAERYITAELKEHESAVLGADEKATALEADLFRAVVKRVADEGAALLKTARALAEVDVLIGLTEAALRGGYVRPELTDGDTLEISSGRHPVVDATTGGFVPNDLHLGSPTRLIVLTGPNMSGKSTYLRQAALIVLMAQMGSYVPAKFCRLGLCDRIFTRIGAKDEIALGQSTFMVEMVESANILNNATSRSLVVLDEVGRGTSTYDGLSIAWAMAEHLATVGAKTLFATHYHQMNAIAAQMSRVANFRVEVREVGDQVVWTHRVLPGGADKSYGLQVAKMAGVPPSVLRRAGEVLEGLENQPATAAPPELGPRLQLTLFEPEPHAVVAALERIQVDQLTPIEALVKLDELKRTLGEGRTQVG